MHYHSARAQSELWLGGGLMKWSLVFDGLRQRARWTSVEDVRRAFSDYHEALHWLAGLVVDDEHLASACVVDACMVAERQSQMFHEWLIHWAGMATVRCAVQRQHERISELAHSYAAQPDPQDLERPPLSDDHCHALIENAELIRQRMDLLCRLVLVVRGIARNSYDETAAELGISPAAAKHAYAAAFDTLQFVSTHPLEYCGAPAGLQ